MRSGNEMRRRVLVATLAVIAAGVAAAEAPNDAASEEATAPGATAPAALEDALLLASPPAVAWTGSVQVGVHYCADPRVGAGAGPSTAPCVDVGSTFVPPGEVTVAATSETKLIVRWTPLPGSSGVVAYAVRRGGEPIGTVTSGELVDAGLTAGTERCYTVSSRDVLSGTETEPSRPVCARTPDRTPPARPAWLAAAPGSGEGIALRWGPAEDNVGVVEYRLHRADGAGRSFASTEAQDADVLAGREYCYDVVAVDAAGNASPPSPSACARAPKSVPAVTVAATSPSEVTIAIQAPPAGPIPAYELIRDDAVLGRYTAATTVDRAVAPGSRHCYALRAVATGALAAPPQCVTTPGTKDPLPVGGLVGATTDAQRIELTWSPSPAERRGRVVYAVFWDLDDQAIGMTRKTRFALSGLHPGERHCYTVGVVDEAGRRSPRSLPACVGTAAAPPASR